MVVIMVMVVAEMVAMIPMPTVAIVVTNNAPGGGQQHGSAYQQNNDSHSIHNIKPSAP